MPPLIGRYRPDIIGHCVRASADLLIAEAKTDGDLVNQHTIDQVDAFIAHLRSRPRGVGTFILTVNGRVADRARTLLRLAGSQHVSSRLCINLFDGLDFWVLGSSGGPAWRLC